MKFTKNDIKHLENDYTQVVSQNGFNFLSFREEAQLLCNELTVKTEWVDAHAQVQYNSIATVFLTAASLGLSFSRVLNHMAVSTHTYNDDMGLPAVRFEMHITYRGLLHLGYETGAILHLQPWVIHAKDQLRLSAGEPRPILDIESFFADRGPVVGAICTVAMSNGEHVTSHISAEELEQIASMSNNPDWYGPFADEYRKKQVIKRALRDLPSKIHPRLASASKFLISEEAERNTPDNSLNQNIPTSSKRPGDPSQRLSALYGMSQADNEEAAQPSNECSTDTVDTNTNATPDNTNAVTTAGFFN